MDIIQEIILKNGLKDPNYNPYCGRCKGLVRMQKVEHLYWRHHCGAVHDARNHEKEMLTELANAQRLAALNAQAVEELNQKLRAETERADINARRLEIRERELAQVKHDRDHNEALLISYLRQLPNVRACEGGDYLGAIQRADRDEAQVEEAIEDLEFAKQGMEYRHADAKDFFESAIKTLKNVVRPVQRDVEHPFVKAKIDALQERQQLEMELLVRALDEHKEHLDNMVCALAFDMGLGNWDGRMPIHCAYCAGKFDDIKTHILTCAEHPMAKVKRDLDAIYDALRLRGDDRCVDGVRGVDILNRNAIRLQQEAVAAGRQEFQEYAAKVRKLVAWGFATGRYYLEVAGITVAVEADPCRDSEMPGEAWTGDMIKGVYEMFQKEVAHSG